jgi:polyisoprenoid-binding protein YceI
MPTFGPETASLELFVFREGVLARAGHDLLVRATKFEVTTDPAARTVTVDVDATSLRVVAALREGRPLPDALSAADVREIETTMAGTILRAPEFPRIRFASEQVSPRGDGFDVRGALTLAGVTRPIAFTVRRDGEQLVAELRLAQPDFGIRPYTAMLGGLKIRPLVGVRAVLPASAAGG